MSCLPPIALRSFPTMSLGCILKQGRACNWFPAPFSHSFTAHIAIYCTHIPNALIALQGPLLTPCQSSSASVQADHHPADWCLVSPALVGALGITPLDFLLPLAMYIFLRKPVLWKKIMAWILLVFYVIVMILGAVAAIRGIVLDASEHSSLSAIQSALL